MRLLCVVTIALAACGLSVQGSESGGSGLADAGSQGDALPPVPTTPIADADSDTATREDSGAPIDVPCRGTQGPRGIPVEGFCIDRTEVTRSQYAAFIVAGPHQQAGPCSGNTFPEGMVGDERPMASLDWCDARAYCSWAGKRLCTRPELRRACSPTGTGYPYGPSVETGRCNTASAGNGATVAVATTRCATPSGIHDLVGNVWEWSSECTSENAEANCFFASGGAFNHIYDCSINGFYNDRSFRAVDVGFRCCAELK